MNHRGLQLRMAIVGAILFAVYMAAATVAMAVWGLHFWVVAVLSVVIVVAQYVIGKKMAIRGAGAEDMPEDGQYARIHQSTEELCREMDLEKPRLMVADMGVPNAFAVGRRGAGVVVVSSELIRLLDHDELEGVIAHELAHLDNRDVLTMTIGQSVAMIAGMAAYWLVLLTSDNNGLADFVLGYAVSIVVNMAVMVFVMAISRYREYVADADAADAIGRGEPLASALEKISQGTKASGREIDDDVAALCIFGGADSLFSTHPPTEKRIQRLRERV